MEASWTVWGSPNRSVVEGAIDASALRLVNSARALPSCQRGTSDGWKGLREGGPENRCL
ncbi:hypothetical protein M378DRAFT_18682 [Amanita muscaria Koide BX008]|uniref:Uncharacterized protein n=1 Tax=Amanita muscaria (strain Koide BX008) TaxID=946122 RepID=A0A0C2WEZ1_AMAMK|nr:hypothetical protein M378DRAFT_18682 [Amanita muscaria Koide BX008]